MALTQFYIVEVQQYADDSFGHLVHYAYDEDPDLALRKAESKYYDVLSAAAVSNTKMHSAILFSTEGHPLMDKFYKHNVTVEPEPAEE